MILVIVAIGGMSAFGLLSTIVFDEMLDEVNAHLPKELRFSEFGWWAGKALRLHSEYRRLFPMENFSSDSGRYRPWGSLAFCCWYGQPYFSSSWRCCRIVVGSWATRKYLRSGLTEKQLRVPPLSLPLRLRWGSGSE
jgi:hypothetical protein